MMNFLKRYIKKIKFQKYENKISQTANLSLKATIKRSDIGNYCGVAKYADISDVTIGDYSSIGRYSKIVHTKIGKFCSISWDVTINAISHPINHLSTNAFAYVPQVGNFVTKRTQQHKMVNIENDVWIGANSVIMPGIHIGNGAVIGAGSVVTKDVPDYAIVGGAPAKIIKYRFEKDIIDRLLELKWWDLPKEVLKNNINLFQKPITNGDIDKLCVLLKAH